MAEHASVRDSPEPVMVPAWLRNLVLTGFLLVGLVDLASPVVLRVQLDATAIAAVASANRAYHRGAGAANAEAAARAVAEADDATIEHFEVLPDGRVTLTLAKTASSSVLSRVSQLEGWYAVEADATSTGRVL